MNSELMKLCVTVSSHAAVIDALKNNRGERLWK